MQRYVPSGKGDSLRISLPRKDFENHSSPKGFVDPLPGRGIFMKQAPDQLSDGMNKFLATMYQPLYLQRLTKRYAKAVKWEPALAGQNS